MQYDDDEFMDEDESYQGPDLYVDDGETEELDLDTESQDAEQQSTEQSSGGSTLRELLLGMSRNTDDGTGGEPVIHIAGIGLVPLSRLLAIAGRSSTPSTHRRTREAPAVEVDDEDVEDEEEEEDDNGQSPRSRYRASKWAKPAAEPQDNGVELLMGGEFGRTLPKVRSRTQNVNVARALLDRRAQARGHHKEDLATNIVPNSNGTSVATYADTDIYSGQFSTDSSFYYTCCRDFRLHVYDTTVAPVQRNPVTRAPRTGSRTSTRHEDDLEYGHDTTMKVIKTIRAEPGRWTITDSHLSPDNERMIYASITPIVYMTNVLDSSPVQIPIRFSDPVSRQRTRHWMFDDDGFGIWSCRFSADGNEVVAGGSGKIFVYDLISDRRTVKISAHGDDVNSCCWADTASGNVLISASDDTFLKVWDRRSIGSSQKPSGVLVGHTEGITFVSAKGDGRYVISNGKDQALRLWDLRKMRSSTEFDAIADRHYGVPDYDYRHGSYPRPRYKAHPQDCSIMAYRGHAVFRTLIRCHFSPMGTTGSQYIYSGSADGKVHIWSLDGRVVQVLDRAHTLPISFDPSGPDPAVESLTSRYGQSVVVRDVSWHAQEPVLMSAGWSGDSGKSSVARHEWKGLSKMGGSLEDWNEKATSEHTERVERRRRSHRVPGAFVADDD